MNEEKLQMMREEKIPRVLLKMGIPTMIGMMVSALYSVVDAYFVGGLGTSQMGAVSIVFPISMVVVGLGMTFGSGAASYVSRLLGEGKDVKANQTASTALFTSLAVGTVAICITLCFLDSILVSLGATATILPYARTFAKIYIASSILTIFNVTMNNIITAEGRAKLTMTAMLLSCGLNIIFNPLFIYGLDMGIRGSAVSTVFAQGATMLLYLRYIMGRKGYLRFSLHHFTFNDTIYKEVFKVGIPILVFQLLSSAAMGLSNTAASDYGDAAVAAVGVVTRIMTLGTYVVFGFMKGFQPVAGYNYGAQNYDRLNEAIRVSLKWATVFCTVAALIMVVLPQQIVSLFSHNDAILIDIGARALRANGIAFIFFGFQMVYLALFLALGYGREGGLLSICRQGLFFIPAILILPVSFGLEGIIWVQPAADLSTVALTGVLAFSLHKRINAFATLNKELKEVT